MDYFIKVFKAMPEKSVNMAILIKELKDYMATPYLETCEATATGLHPGY